jgi:hypothetical protein
VNNGTVSDDVVITYGDVGGAVNDGVIFNTGVVSDACFTEIRSDNGPGPDARVLSDFYITYHVGGLADECRSCYFGALTIEVSNQFRFFLFAGLYRVDLDALD